MPKNIQVSPRPFTVYTEKNLEKIPQLSRFSPDQVLAMRAVANVLPFRVNDYVIDELIDWDRVPDDPMFQLTFPQPGMLKDGELDAMLTSAGVTSLNDNGDEAPQRARDDVSLHLAPEVALTIFARATRGSREDL